MSSCWTNILTCWHWDIYITSNIKFRFSSLALFLVLSGTPIFKAISILCANIISGFNMWKHIALYFYHKYSLGSQILYCKCVQLYVAFVKIYLITIQTAAQSSVRCVFKILNITRFFLLLALKWILISFLISTTFHHFSPFLSHCN